MNKTVAIIIVIVFILGLYGCGNTEKGPKSSPIPTATPLPIIKVNVDPNDGILAVGEKHTVGVMTSGMAVYAGHNELGQTDVASWQNIIYLAANEDTTAGVTKEGTLKLTGGHYEKFKSLLNITNIVSVTMGKNHMAVLTKDGFVYTTGDNNKLQCDTEGWCEVIKLIAGADFTLALKQDGTLLFAGNDPTLRIKAESFLNVKDIAVGEDFFAVINGEGKLLATIKTDVESISTVAPSIETPVPMRIFAGANILLSISDDKKININYSNDTLKMDGIDEFLKSLSESEFDVLKIAIAKTHISAALSDGSVLSFGDNSELSCATDYMKLKPVITEDKLLTGLSDNMTVSELLPILKESLNLKTPIFKNKTVELLETDLIATGAELHDGKELIATVLIYGDVDGNGLIDEADALKIDSHVAGTDTLKGYSLIAADVLHSAGGRIISAQSDLIRAYSNKTANIKQYIYNPLKESLDKMIAENPDVLGYIKLHGTNIDYPILYGENWYYNYYSIDKVKRTAASIYSVNSYFARNNAIAGHNARTTGTMFHEMHKIQNNKEDLLTYANRVYSIQFIEGYSEWEVFALYETEEDEPVETQMSNITNKMGETREEIQAWLDITLKRSEINLGVSVSPDDTFITLYTCGDNYLSGSNPDQQARLYIFLRRVA
ncbi:MAG: sortase [Clostridia bacterium]